MKDAATQLLLSRVIRKLGFLIKPEDLRKFQPQMQEEYQSWIDITSIEIEKSEMGLFSNIIDSCEVEIKAAIGVAKYISPEETLAIKLYYKYKHPSGSNGYTVTKFYSLDGELISTESF